MAAFALRRTALIVGTAGVLLAIVLGAYTVLSRHPDCVDLYLCRRVVDRTVLLGYTAMAAAAWAGVIAVVATRIGRHGATVLRVVLIVGACILAAAYWKTQFGSLRADLAHHMALTPAVWTASTALWSAVGGFLGLALGAQPR
ncbi:MAG: hypothetical protein HYZ39_23085 [Mycolicibacterium cosmeticum]|nr:hypothetical protein [Mycolicibacterium cosmeticum]